MKVTRRTFLSSGVGAAVAAIPSYRLVAAAESPDVRICLVTGDRPRRLDVAQVFEELGLVVDLVEESGLTKLDPASASLLWIVATTYPDPMEISAANLGVIEKFLEAGKGVFVEFASNFPGVRPAGPIRRADVARLFVAEAAAYPESLPQGAILDPHDAVLLPFEATETARAIVQIGKIAGVEKFDSTIPPKNLIPGVLLGERGPGHFAVAATSISEFARRQYAPQAHWTRLLQDLTLTLLPAVLRNRILADHIPLRAHTEPRRWAMPGTAVRLVIDSASGVALTLAGQSDSAWKETVPGRYEAQLPAQAAGEKKLNLRATRGRAARAATVELRVEDRKAAYRRALDNNLRWFEESGVLLRADGSLGVAEWISGPDTEGNRIPFGKRQGYSPERSDCVFESALAYWLYGKVAASDRHRDVGRNMLMNVMDFQRLSVERLLLRPLVHARPRRADFPG